VSESGLVELIRQASRAGDMKKLSAFYAVTDAKPEWRSARRAMEKAPCGDLERHQAQLQLVKARAKLGLDAVIALKVGRKIHSEAKIAAGLAAQLAQDASA